MVTASILFPGGARFEERTRYKNISFRTCIALCSAAGVPTTPMKYYMSNNFLIQPSTLLIALRPPTPQTSEMINVVATCIVFESHRA
jgi:hypothetical protein